MSSVNCIVVICTTGDRDGSKVRSAILVWHFLSCGENVLEVGSGGGCASENKLKIALLVKNKTKPVAGQVLCSDWVPAD